MSFKHKTNELLNMTFDMQEVKCVNSRTGQPSDILFALKKNCNQSPLRHFKLRCFQL